MIIEPQFPQSFCRFLAAIVGRQIQTDKARAKLSESSLKQLFSLFDSTGSGSIYLQDIYVFLKKRGVNLSKKQLKFVNRYFGFSRCEKLSLTDFQNYFFQVRDPKNTNIEKEANQVQALIDLIELVLEGYTEIEEQRLIAARDIDELRICLCKFYKDESGIISNQVLKEALYSLQLYSRLNYTLLRHYVIGQQLKEINLKQLFLGDSSCAQTSSYPELKENKKISTVPTTPQVKVPGSFKQKNDSNDILLQIENIESSIKQKKELYTQRKRMLEEECKKPVGMLVKRPSQTDLKTNIKNKNQNSILDFKDNKRSKFYPKQDKPENILLSVAPEILGQQPKKDYSFIDAVEERKDLDSQEIEEMIRSRMSSKAKEETLNKASSCARLKIQQIERRVMGRVGQRAAASRIQQYVSRIPSDLHMKSSELRSRYSSLNRS